MAGRSRPTRVATRGSLRSASSMESLQRFAPILCWRQKPGGPATPESRGLGSAKVRSTGVSSASSSRSPASPRSSLPTSARASAGLRRTMSVRLAFSVPNLGWGRGIQRFAREVSATALDPGHAADGRFENDQLPLRSGLILSPMWSSSPSLRTFWVSIAHRSPPALSSIGGGCRSGRAHRHRCPDDRRRRGDAFLPRQEHLRAHAARRYFGRADLRHRRVSTSGS